MEETYKKPCIARGIFVSIKKKNKIYNKFCQTKDSERKKSLHETFKKYRNIIANLTRIGKGKHYKKTFRKLKITFAKHDRV